MQGIPPIDAELDDRQVDHTDQREDRAGAIATDRIVKCADQYNVPEVEKEQYQY